MAKKISEGSALSPILTGDLFEVERPGDATFYKATSDALLAYVKSLTPVRMPFVTDNWYMTIRGGVIAAGTAHPVNTIRLYPVAIHTTVTIKALGCRVSTAGTSVQLAVYGSHGTTGKPDGAVLGKTASITITSTGLVGGALVGGNLTLTPGIYWFASNVDNAASVFATVGAGSTETTYIMGSATGTNVINSSSASCLTYSVVSSTFNTWQTMTGATFAETNATTFPLQIFQVA